MDDYARPISPDTLEYCHDPIFTSRGRYGRYRMYTLLCRRAGDITGAADSQEKEELIFKERRIAGMGKRLQRLKQLFRKSRSKDEAIQSYNNAAKLATLLSVVMLVLGFSVGEWAPHFMAPKFYELFLLSALWFSAVAAMFLISEILIKRDLF